MQLAKYFTYWIMTNYGFASAFYFYAGDWIRGLYWIFAIGIMACAMFAGR